MKRHNLGRSFIACLLAVTMLLGTCGTVLATDDASDEIVYVSLGDSMTNGYGLPGYERINDDGSITNWYGFQRDNVEGSYPWKVADNYGWTLSQLATSGLRADDVYYLLNLGTDYEVNWDEYGRRHMPEKFEQSYEEAFGAGSDDDITAYAADIYQAEVKDADVISVGIGSNNFATLMDLRMMWWMGRILGDESMFAGGGYNGPFDFNELVADLTAEQKAEMEELYAKSYVKAEQLLKDAASDAGISLEYPLTYDATLSDMVEDISNAIAYTTAGFTFGYKGIIDTIIRENNDAEIIIVGLTNWFRGMVYGVPVGDEIFEFPMGDLMDVVCDLAGVYMAALPAAYKTAAQINGTELQPIYFADTNADGVGNVELIVDVIVENTPDVDLDSLNEFELGSNERFEAAYAMAQSITSAAIPVGTTRARLLEAMGGYVLSMMSGLGIATPTLKQVEMFEPWYADGMPFNPMSQSFMNFAMSLPNSNNPVMGGDPTPYIMGCIAYLGLEKSMISSLHLDVVNVEHFQVLSSVQNLMDVTMGALAGHMTSDNDIAGALIAVPELGTISNLMFNFLVGSGVIVHPSDDGHSTIANVIIDAYDRKWTATDETIDNLKEAAEIAKGYIEEYYDEAYAYAYAEADKAGYVDTAALAIDKAIEVIMNLDLSGVEMTDDFRAKLEAECMALISTLNEIKVVLIEDKASDVEGLYNSAMALWDDLNTHLTLATAILAQAEVDVKTLLCPVVDAYIKTLIEEYVKPFINEAKGELSEIEFKKVDHKHYEADEDSYYVALGSDTLEGAGIERGDKYYRLIANEYGISTKQIYERRLLPKDALTLIEENVVEIAKADLITYQLDANNFIWATMNEEADWDKYIDEYVDEDVQELVEKIVNEATRVLTMDWTDHSDAKLAEIIAEVKAAVLAKVPEEIPFAEEIFDAAVEFVVPYLKNEIAKIEAKRDEVFGKVNNKIASVDETTKDYAEKFAYAFVAYAIETAKAVEAIEMINPDATLVVIGMYNPLRGLKVAIGEEELDVEEYFEYVIDATNNYYSALSMIDNGFAFVDVSEAETEGINLTIDVADPSELISAISPMITSLNRNMHANTDGHEYIKEQVVNALICDYSVYEAIDAEKHAVKCSICGFINAEEAHEFGDDNVCDKCGYEKVVVPPVDPEDPEDPTPTPGPSYGGSVGSSKPAVKFNFKDVSKGAWYYDYIKTLFEKGYMNGISDTEFAPDATLTRGMFVTVLHRIEKEPKAKNGVTFTDVAAGKYYENAVKWAAANGIVLGISETEFAPEEEVTREQMAAILARYVEYKKVKVTASGDVEYTDNAEISDYAKDAVVVANKLGILIGNDDGSFAPKSDATRAQAAALFVRLLEKLK